MSDPARTVLVALDELAVLVGFVLVAGPLALWVTATPNGRSDRRQLRIVLVGALLLGVATVAAPLVGATGVTGAVSPDVVSRESWAAILVRLALLAALLGWIDVLVSRPILGARRGWATAVVVLLSLTFVLPSEAVAAHGGIAGVVIAVALLAHVLAAAVWLGGIVVTAAVGLPVRDLSELSSVVRSFSRTTVATVATVVVSSVVLVAVASRDLGAWVSSGQGVALGVKALAFAAMVYVAQHGRRHLDVMLFHRLRVGADSLSRVGAWSLLIRAQLLLAAVLLVGTAAIVVSGPPG